jgi:molybdate transport system substrate-binding protein
MGMATGGSSAAEPLRLAAAGSLRQPMQEIAAAFTQATDVPVTLEFGASGMLRDKITATGSADVFASANLEHPAALAKAGKALPEVVFARNRLCALARPEVTVTSATLLATLLDPAIRVGTSTPKSDPSGDYAWQVFAKAEALKPGARAALEAKALQLTGGPTSSLPPTDRSIYGLLLETHKADVMLIYCTAARQAAREVAGLHIVELPDPLAVGADYGLTVLKGSRPGAERLALFILSSVGQTILAKSGFAAPALPAAQ